MKLQLSCIDDRLGLWCVAGETNGYLLVRGGRALLIDCPAPDTGRALARAGLPRPDAILHTQIQEEHCREWGDLADVPVHVPAAAVEVARRSNALFQACRTQWPLDRRWDPQDRGMDRYGIGGRMTERPPARPLNVAGTLRPGKVFRWQDLVLAVVPLPGSGRHAVGLCLRGARILFAGDLLHAGGRLVNLFDLERGYGIGRGYEEAADSLRRVIALRPRLVLPTTGPVVRAPLGDARRLLAALHRFRTPVLYSPRRQPCREVVERRRVGLFQQHAEGLWQNWNNGCVILFIDPQGRACCFDPDICVWQSWEENCRQMHAQLDLLEREAGLKRIELAVITHPHGDHMEYAPLLRERYGTETVATADIAEILEHPLDYPYVCLLDWFNFPFSSFSVDRRLRYEQPLHWRGVELRPFHSPGHCFAHSGWLLEWRGRKIACTGDALQHDGGPVSTLFRVIYSDAGSGARGYLPTYERLLAEKPDLVLGAHSQWFDARDGTVLRDLRQATLDWEARGRAVVRNDDLDAATNPPGFDAARALLLARARQAAPRFRFSPLEPIAP